ncbi:hypothetical protein BH11BAC5_BH11BAC5_03140 [soil metagenome]
MLNNFLKLKQVLVFLFVLLGPVLLFCQQSDTIPLPVDSMVVKTDSVITQPDSLQLRLQDSLVKVNDSINAVVTQRVKYTTDLQKLLMNNIYLNWNGKPVAMVNKTREHVSQDKQFYLLAGIIFLLGFCRFFYIRYFNNLFRVFFNASLRQSQLTDQLLQAKLPSLFFNIIFILAGGVYVYLVLNFYNWIPAQSFWLLVLYCGLSLGMVYFIKFITLKFTGWVTGFKEITNTYIFVIFLINKILGVILLPFIVVIAFGNPVISSASVIISLFLIGLMFVLRFFRSYGLLQHQLKISSFHFFMYVIGIEVLPLLLIYKGLILLLGKNL